MDKFFKFCYDTLTQTYKNMSDPSPSTPPTNNNDETHPLPEDFPNNNTVQQRCETVDDDVSAEGKSTPPTEVSTQILDKDNQQQNQNAPPPTTTQVCESSSDECIFIPKHAVVDDITLKFILHPNLTTGLNSGSSEQLCTNEETRPASCKGRASCASTTKEDCKISDDSKTTSHGKVAKMVLPNKRNSATRASNSSSVRFSNEPEQYVIKTAKEILYDIAKGKWNRKGMIIDEETEGTKKISSKPCSNANCVRAAERERRKKDQLLFQSYNKNINTVFEDGQLPSYHSLLNVWKYQENQKQQHTWLHGAFKNGFPENEDAFLKVWRECRKNPEAFGVQKSVPGALPDIQERRFGSRVRKVVKPYEKRLLVGEVVNHSPPVRLASKEYYSPDWKPMADLNERRKQKNRYDALRKLYPHLPPLRSTDYKLNPATVRYRMRQAEEWHKLVTISNKPKPMVQLSYYAADVKNNFDKTPKNGESCPGSESAESSELDFQSGSEVPRYATSTASRMSKVRQRRNPF